MGSDTMTFEQILGNYSASELNYVFIGLIIGFLFAAFFGFRFFKLAVVLSCAASGYTFGAVTLGTALGDVSGGFDFTVILGIASAIIFALVSLKIYKAFIYLAGGLIGALLGFVIPYSVFLAFGLETVGTVVGIILAIVLFILGARLMYRIIKPYLIVSTSISGSFGACVVLALLLFGENTAMIGVFLACGLVLSIIAMLVQFRMNRGRTLDL